MVPLRSTGSRIATGVKLPVRPTPTSTSRNTEKACSAVNLKAVAQRGDFAVKPSCRCCLSELIFSTMPSIS